MKRTLIVLFAFLLIFSYTGNVQAADSRINVSIDGEMQSYEQPPVSVNGNTLVPLRDIFEALGASIEWDGATRTVKATKDDILISLQIGSSVANVNGETIQLVQPAEIINRSTMVPVRFVSEALGATVEWDGATRTVVISSNHTQVETSGEPQSEDNVINHDDKIVDTDNNTEIVQPKEYNQDLSDDLVKAVEDNNLDLVRGYLWKKADPNATDLMSMTVLGKATMAENSEMVQALLEAGADPNKADEIFGISPIFYASENGNKEIVKMLIEAGANLNIKDKLFEGTPIFSAVDEGHKEIVELLINSGADITIANKDGITPMMESVNIGNIDIFKIFLDHGMNINSKDDKGATALMHAAGWGNEEMVQYLLDNGALPFIIDDDGWSPLMYASGSGNPKIVKLLLDAGSSPDLKDKGGYDAVSPLLIAAKGSHTEVMKLLVEAGADVNYADKDGWTAIIYSAKLGNYAAVQLLIDNGANIEAADKNQVTPLMFASAQGYKDIVDVLLEAGANVNRSDNENWSAMFFAASNYNDENPENYIYIIKSLHDKGAKLDNQDTYGGTSLINAIYNDQNELAKVLIELGANVDKSDNDNWTALMYAANHGNAPIVKLLLEAGANPNYKDDEGVTPFMEAAAQGDNEVAELLINAGAMLNIKDNKNWTPLMYIASGENNIELAKIILDKGAAIDAQNDDGLTPLMIAAVSGRTEMVNFLLESGADINILDNYQGAALFYAVIGNDLGSIQSLIDAGSDINARDSDGFTPLYIVANRTYSPEALKLLLNLGADPNIADNEGYTPLMNVALSGDNELLELLLKGGADPNIDNNDGMTALIYAAGQGYKDTVQLLLENGVDLDFASQGQGARYFANQFGYPEIVELLDNAIDVNTSKFNINSTETTDSKVIISGDVAPKTTWVWVEISNPFGFKKNVFVKPENGKVNKTIYFNGGKGYYTVNIWETTEEEAYGTYYYMATSYRVANSDDRDRYLVPSEKVESDSKEIIDLAKQITVGLTTDREKSMAIHDWVSKNIAYDTSVINGDDVAHSALETLHLKVTDCDGYTRLTTALHRAIGIPAKFISGESIDSKRGEQWGSEPTINHAWNEVYLDGKWVTIDTTWDAGYIDNRNRFVAEFSQDYFDPIPDFFNRDHRKIEESNE